MLITMYFGKRRTGKKTANYDVYREKKALCKKLKALFNQSAKNFFKSLFFVTKSSQSTFSSPSLLLGYLLLNSKA